VENATEPQQLRVIKRCELILNVVQRLQPALSVIMNNTTHEKSVRGQGDSSHGTDKYLVTFVKRCYSIKQYAVKKELN